jgi:toxin ParE1/3/4
LSAEQADKTLRSMFSRFQYLTEKPHLGEKRDDVKTGYYCLRQEGYLIFYTKPNDCVDVIAILPQSMDVVDYLG